MPFEFSAIRHDWCRMVRFLSSKDVLNWEVRPGRECLSPKRVPFAFRVCPKGTTSAVRNYCFPRCAECIFDGIAHANKEQAVWPKALEKESFLSSPVFTIRRITSNVNNSVITTMNTHHAMVSSSSYIFLIHNMASLNKQTVRDPI